MHSLVFFVELGTRRRSRHCSQAEFDMDVLTIYLPATFDKFRSITEKAVLLQSVMKLIKSRWLDLRLLRQHADWSQL
jgi:hypothetical protein